MKLRLDKHSVRLRVRKSDLEQLRRAGMANNEVAFLNQTLTYTLLVDKDIPEVAAVFVDQQIRISLPEQIAQKWMNSDQVGIEATLTSSAGVSLSVLIEKDFPCIDRPEEDNQDTFVELAEKQQAPKC